MYKDTDRAILHEIDILLDRVEHGIKTWPSEKYFGELAKAVIELCQETVYRTDLTVGYLGESFQGQFDAPEDDVATQHS